MKCLRRSISYMAVLLACSAGTMPVSAQQATAFASITSNSQNVTSPLVQGLDGNPAYMNVISGYAYVATFYEALDPHQPLSEVTPIIDGWQEIRTTEADQSVAIGPSFRASGGLYESMAFGNTKSFNVAAVSYHGSIISINLAPRTRVTFTSELEHALRVTSPENYKNPDDPELPGVLAFTYAYLGPVASNALNTHGFNRGLFDADDQGYICPGCDSNGIYWQDQFLEPDPGQAGYLDGVNVHRDAGGMTTQQYTITNDGDSEAIFHVLRFSGATAMNVVQASAIPEVDTLALFGIGMFGVALAARRKARH